MSTLCDMLQFCKMLPFGEERERMEEVPVLFCTTACDSSISKEILIKKKKKDTGLNFLKRYRLRNLKHITLKFIKAKPKVSLKSQGLPFKGGGSLPIQHSFH